MSTLSNFSYLREQLATRIDPTITNIDNILFEVEVTKAAQALLLGSPHTVDDILDVQNEVRLAVPRITEGHVRRIGLRNRRKG